MPAPTCPYCGEPTKRLTGAELYGPFRSRGFEERVFWNCSECDAYVGCHPGTETALGTPAKAPLRKLRSQVHAALDPLWRGSARKRMRAEAYGYLAKALAIDPSDCHVGLFDEARCQEALAILAKATPEAIAQASAEQR